MAKLRLPAALTATTVPHLPDALYVGLDQSYTGSGITIFDANGFVAHALVETKPGNCPMDEIRRLTTIWTKIKAFVDGRNPTEKPVALLMEDFAFSQANQMANLGGLGWYLRMCIATQTEWHFGACSPGTLKAVATGKGNAPKEVVMMGVYKRWQFESDNNNVADAYVLGHLAWVLYGKPATGAPRTLAGDFTSVQKIKVYR